MLHLYNSQGLHVATEANGYLYSKTGKLIGRYLERLGVYLDLHGRYLGEILCLNRLAFNHDSRYLNASFDPCTYHGAIGPHEKPKDFSPLPLPPGFTDVDLERVLRAS